jgi:hypothetical protein
MMPAAFNTCTTGPVSMASNCPGTSSLMFMVRQAFSRPHGW